MDSLIALKDFVFLCQPVIYIVKCNLFLSESSAKFVAKTFNSPFVSVCFYLANCFLIFNLTMLFSIIFKEEKLVHVDLSRLWTQLCLPKMVDKESK